VWTFENPAVVPSNCPSNDGGKRLCCGGGERFRMPQLHWTARPHVSQWFSITEVRPTVVVETSRQNPLDFISDIKSLVRCGQDRPAVRLTIISVTTRCAIIEKAGIRPPDNVSLDIPCCSR
jgi:hypothetical protein